MIATATKTATVNEARWLLSAARAPRLRTPRQFAEQEIVIPDGPYEGRQFSCVRQPYTALWLSLIASHAWNRFFACGPTQSGKTLACFIVPLLYHLFEIGETVICGVPSMEMAGDKWRQDILPAIERSRYRDLLPASGQGSKGGAVESMQFRHGPTLKFMSGGGNDKKRAGFTARVLVITEVDGMDESGGKSREADKITQLEGRLRAYGNRKRVYGECTVSIEDGRTWREWLGGTQSKLYLPCPHCRRPVHPTRESLVGWQGAENEHEAAKASSIYCPDCGESWSESQRRTANENALVVHRGQEIADDGTVAGELPPTNTLGFRWDAINNLFVSPGDVGAEEWKASRSHDEDNAEKEMRQFVWALPYIPSVTDSTPLAIDPLTRRQTDWEQGKIPAGFDLVTVGVDCGKWLHHWVAVAWSKDGTSQVIDYGRQEVPSNDIGVERAIIQALRELRDAVAAGWKHGDTEDRRPSSLSFVDAGYQTESVYAFVRESGQKWLASDGIGTAQEHKQHYNRPKSTGATVKFIGDNYHLSLQPKQRLYLAEVHADYWKSWVHERLKTPLSEVGAMSLFHANPNDHLSFAKHLTAEKQVEEFIAGRGTVKRWVVERKANHWFDALYNACAAAHYCGVRLVKSDVAPVREYDSDDAPSRVRELKLRGRG